MKWWLRDFCEFQYGSFSEDTNNKAHQSYIKLLKKHGLWSEKEGACMPPIGGMDTPKDKEKDKDKDKDKEKDKELRACRDWFEDFWELYPRKVAKAKAWDKWQKLKPDEELFQEIMEGLKRYIQSDQWQQDEGQFIPHPLTFLNQERWNDDVGVRLPRSELPKCPNCGKSLENELRNRSSHCYNSDCDADIREVIRGPPQRVGA
jgi:hypothetical protein